jgi:hypothetical protein
MATPTINIPAGLPIYTLRAESPDKREGQGLELNEIERLIKLAEQMICKHEPREAEYWRGLCRGLQYYSNGKSDGTNQDHFTLINLAVYGCGDPYVAAFARGYHDGFTGKGPEFMV